MAEIDGHHIARMAPIGLERDAFRQRIHGVADDQIGLVEKGLKRLLVGDVVHPVLGIGRLILPLKMLPKYFNQHPTLVILPLVENT